MQHESPHSPRACAALPESRTRVKNSTAAKSLLIAFSFESIVFYFRSGAGEAFRGFQDIPYRQVFVLLMLMLKKRRAYPGAHGRRQADDKRHIRKTLGLIPVARGNGAPVCLCFFLRIVMGAGMANGGFLGRLPLDRRAGAPVAGAPAMMRTAAYISERQERQQH